ncbi:LysR family transcriptional regulator [Lichenihabitans sp. PAMC28606]|uniref:LysR family transcriptional regulator n=1 Tax=Lichenihabitans sp. PAMC28606 TaxID=2880932 RepID=UPI001D0ACAE4|nr:LysR family transcriptional regulator [Lichenihabitans sp. PAMC28606]UDL94071.1 LysR family transcriptional regulator [Lichenihabitans sp. PAMC28606]
MAYDGRLLAGVSVLMAVVEAGAFARAADALGVTPSGVSRAIARLEARIGVRLLDRTTRALSLTDEGRRFYETVAPMLDGIAEAALDAAGAARVARGRLRVNVDPFFARIVLADRLAAFMEQNPAVRLELIMRDHVGDLVADGFDLAIRFGDPPVGGFTTRKLVETRVLTVASPDYVARRGAPTHPSEVADHDCIEFYNAAVGRAFDWEFRRGGEVLAVKPAARLMVSDVGTMLTACEAGAGLAQILELGARHLIKRGTLVPVLADWSDERFPLYALFPSHRHRTAKVRAFVQFCDAILGEHERAPGPVLEEALSRLRTHAAVRQERRGSEP